MFVNVFAETLVQRMADLITCNSSFAHFARVFMIQVMGNNYHAKTAANAFEATFGAAIAKTEFEAMTLVAAPVFVPILVIMHEMYAL